MKIYRSGKAPLPKTRLVWQMYGAGLENFGRNGKPVELPMPEIGPRELLARVDAIGICFSDVKLITQGNTHVRIAGRDLEKDPATPGHEVSLTVVRVGEELTDKYRVGDRFVVQADVYYKGANIAFGYAMAGGMAQYQVIGREILEGDEGSYLIPLKPDTGYAEAALTEPWACVVAAYRIHPRRTLKAGGNMLVVGAGDVDFSGFLEQPGPEMTVAAGLRPSVLDCVRRLGGRVMEIDGLTAVDVLPLVQERTGGRGFDDIALLGTAETSLVQALSGSLARGGIMNLVADEPLAEPVDIDIGRIHYENWLYVGSKRRDAAEGYRKSRDSALKRGGRAWFIGAAGPMGQMHVQLAISLEDHPSGILCTDVDNGRMEVLRNAVEDSARRKGIDIRFANPAEQPLEEIIAEFADGSGMDDIVCMVPVPKVIEESSRYLADGGVLNIFAGVARGTMARLDLSDVYLRQQRWVGSSGSRIADLEYTLHETEAGRLPARHSLAAIGGMCAMAEGVEAVKTGRFPGKTVIFPQIEDLPLLGLQDLKSVLPEVYAKLEDGRFWTREAEEELLRSRLG